MQGTRGKNKGTTPMTPSTPPPPTQPKAAAPTNAPDPYHAVIDDPALPRVLLIGDSISIGYTIPVQNALAGKANVHRIPENGGDTRRGLAKLSDWLGSGKWAVIHFNFGLHDLKHIKADKLDMTGDQVMTPETYQANLDRLVEALKKTGAALIWGATTPVPEGADGRLKGDDVIFNAAALAVMRKHGIRVNDLYAAVLPGLAQYQQPRNVHFNAAGYAFLGAKVAAAIQAAL